MTPNMSGQFAIDIAASFDLVLYMINQTIDNQPVRMWQTFNDGTALAKDASGALDLFVEPNWRKVFAKILTNPQPQTKETK